VKPPIDLRELANLRNQGWTANKLAKRYLRDRSTIVRILKRIEEESYE
jgi:DNA-binding MarR family transcriptional regulator